MASENHYYNAINRWGQPRVVMTDTTRGSIPAWWGGHGIYAYLQAGTEVSFWNTGDFSQNDASEEAVRESMERHIESGDYP